MEPLEGRDLDYYNECLSDLQQLMYPIVVKRCVVKKRDSSTTLYPDDPITADRQEIHTRADYAGVTAQEVERSGGMILAGDLKIWTTLELRGPEQNNLQIPGGFADIVVLQGHEYVVIGFPDHAELCEGVTPGYASLVRRRATSYAQSGIYNPKK